MPAFSEKSIVKLSTCHPLLQRVFHEVVREFDCTILEGHRDKDRQNQMVAEGKSQVQWPDGKHNTVPFVSRGCDALSHQMGRPGTTDVVRGLCPRHRQIHGRYPALGR